MSRAILTVIATAVLSGCGWIGGDDEIKETCFEPQPYQAERLNEPVKVPDGLDPLDPFSEMPIPKAETPPRPEGAGCITRPPSVRSE